MRVCIISSIFPPYSRGGAETVAYASAAVFAQEHEVSVITCAPFVGWKSFAGAWEKQIVCTPPNLPSERGGSDTVSPPARGGVRGGGSSIRIFRFTPLNLFTIFNIAKHTALLRLIWHVLDVFNVHTYLVVRRILQEEKPDVIFTHNLKGLGYTVPLAIKNVKCKMENLRWLHTIHDIALLHPTGLRIWGQEKSALSVNPIVRLYEWINKKLFGSPECVVSPSRFLLDEYMSRGFFLKSKTAVVRNPAAHNPPQPPSPGLRPPSPRGRGEGEGQRGDEPPLNGGAKEGLRQFRFLYLGQLEPYKGIQILLDAWRIYSAKAPKAELVIAGDGGMREVVVNACAMLARVRYVGWLGPDALAELLDGVHATVVPSYAYENSPTVIGESFVRGIPVIASRIGGIPELVEDAVNGLLIVPNDVVVLCDAMARMVTDWKKLRDGARLAGQAFSLETYKTNLEDLIV